MPAITIDSKVVGRTAAAAIAQFQAVQASGAPAVAAGNAMGFATMATASGARVPVATYFAVAIAGGSIAEGALVEVHTTPTKVVTKASGVAIGRALNAAEDGYTVEILMIPN